MQTAMSIWLWLLPHLGRDEPICSSAYTSGLVMTATSSI